MAGHCRRKYRGDMGEVQEKYIHISTRIKKSPDKTGNEKKKGHKWGKREREYIRGNMCNTRYPCDKEKKKSQREYIRENVQDITFTREGKCAEEIMFAHM